MQCNVTVAILTRNASALIRRVLDAIRSQKTSRSVEILAVDSGSRDGTLDILREYGARVLPIPPESFNFGRTRDFAYENATGHIVVNLSQDAVPMHDMWLENLLHPLNDGAVGAACGHSCPDPEREYPQFPWERNGHFYFTREMRKFRARYGRGLSFANSAVPRRIWRQFRFSSTPLGEDYQFQTRLHEAGFSVAFPEDAQTLHHHAYTIRSLYRRCRDEGAALRAMGCPYTEIDLCADLLSPRKYIQWLREVRNRRLHSSADYLFPLIRPPAVYIGSRLHSPRRLV